MSLPRYDSPLDFEALEAVFVRWANAATGLEVVFGQDENAPQPDRPYIELAWEGFEDIASHEIMDYDATSEVVEITYGALQNVTLDVNIRTHSTKPHENALRYANALATALSAEEYRASLFSPAGVAFSSKTDTTAVPMLEDDIRWRSRAQFNVTFCIASNLTGAENVVPILSTSLTGTLSGGVIDPLTAAMTIAVTA